MLEPRLLLEAYRRGIFPMAVDPDKGVVAGRRGGIGWFSPDPRAIIPLDDRFHVPHGLRRVLKNCFVEGEPKSMTSNNRGSAGASPSKTGFLITFNTDFDRVIRACAKRKEGTWISNEIIESYCALHRLGHAHSVEVWPADRPDPEVGMLRQAQHDRRRKPVGGLYGVHIGGAFFGESMFHRATDASKVALVALVERLRARGFVLLDTQWWTPHLAQFGTHEIPRREYLRRLENALQLDCPF